MHLDLSGLELRRIPDWVFESELVTLYIQNNRLTALPDELGLLEWLEVLDVRFNHLSTLPESLADLANLKEVWTEGNPIELPPWLDAQGRRRPR